MNVKPKTVKRRVGVLRDPEPKFVSLVTHGANQTPFAAVKSAHAITGENNMPIKQRTSAKKTEAEPKATTGVLHVTFAKSEFSDVNAVKAWLKKNEWTGYTIMDEDEQFVAKSNTNTEDSFSVLEPVEMEGGVTATVGKFKSEDAEDGPEDEDGEDENEEDEDGDEDDDKEETSKSEAKEPALKLDYWNMYESNGTTVQQILKDGMSDGVPPGAGEIMAATNYAIGNVLGSNEDRATKRASLAAIGAEMSALIANVYDVFEDATSGETATKQTENVAKFVATFKSDRTALAAKADDKPKEKAKETPAKKSLQVPASKDKDGEGDKSPAFDMEAFADLIGAAVEKAMEPVSKSLDEMGAKVDNAVKASESATKVATKAAETVKEIADRTPSKKSSSQQDEPGKKPSAKTEAENARKAALRENIGNIVGIV